MQLCKMLNFARYDWTFSGKTTGRYPYSTIFIIGLTIILPLFIMLQFTNWQSRTAMVIMPALFAFAFTAENKMIHRMEEVAEETEHSRSSVDWAERQYQQNPDDLKLHDLYRQAVLNSNVQLVDGEELKTHHKVANYVQANPFKVILGVGLPAVGAIFYNRTGKEHVSMQLKILHTRVFGQFAIICTLLGVMGLKSVMDHQGRYITSEEVEQRVNEMQKTRAQMLHRIDEANASKIPHKPPSDDNNQTSSKQQHDNEVEQQKGETMAHA